MALHPRTVLKRSLISSTKKRGHSVSNNWLVYSPKTDRDWLLLSDRELLHWVCFLETNSEVKKFDLAPPAVSGFELGQEIWTEVDAVVFYQDNHVEWHEVKAGQYRSSRDTRQITVQQRAAESRFVKHRVFDDADFEGRASYASRWLSAIAYAAAIRGLELTTETFWLTNVLEDKKCGLVKGLLEITANIPREILIGILIRLAIAGRVTLSLDKAPLGMYTEWQYE